MATATLGRLVIDSLKEDDTGEANKSQEGKLLKINLDLWLWQANRVGETIKLCRVIGHNFSLSVNYSNETVTENEEKWKYIESGKDIWALYSEGFNWWSSICLPCENKRTATWFEQCTKSTWGSCCCNKGGMCKSVAGMRISVSKHGIIYLTRTSKDVFFFFPVSLGQCSNIDKEIFRRHVLCSTLQLLQEKLMLQPGMHGHRWKRASVILKRYFGKWSGCFSP